MLGGCPRRSVLSVERRSRSMSSIATGLVATDAVSTAALATTSTRHSPISGSAFESWRRLVERSAFGVTTMTCASWLSITRTEGEISIGSMLARDGACTPMPSSTRTSIRSCAGTARCSSAMSSGSGPARSIEPRCLPVLARRSPSQFGGHATTTLVASMEVSMYQSKPRGCAATATCKSDAPEPSKNGEAP